MPPATNEFPDPLPVEPSPDELALPVPQQEVAVIVVDHGSRREASNALLEHIVQLYRASTSFSIVEAAHMELARPSIADAFDACVCQGAKLVVIHPYFLLPGRHWDQDIPQLAAEAASSHPAVRYLVTAPLGVHPLLTQVIEARVKQCVEHALGSGPACELCDGTDKCQILAAHGA